MKRLCIKTLKKPSHCWILGSGAPRLPFHYPPLGLKTKPLPIVDGLTEGGEKMKKYVCWCF